MPLLHVIPYVADAFDPGLYVFDGGTFSKDGVMVSVGGRGFYYVEPQTFNISDQLADRSERDFYAFSEQSMTPGYQDFVPIFIDGLSLTITPETQNVTSATASAVNADISPLTFSLTSTIVPEEAQFVPNVEIKISAATVPIDSQYVLTPNNQTVTVAAGEANTVLVDIQPGDFDEVGVIASMIDLNRQFEVPYQVQELTDADGHTTQVVDNIMIASPRDTITTEAIAAVDAITSLAVQSNTEQTPAVTFTLTM